MEKLQVPSLQRSTGHSRASLEEATKQAKLLLGCYRTGEASDPEVYVAAVIAVLARHSFETMRHVCDPSTGLPGKLKWLPTIAEIRQACDEHQEATARAAKRERDMREQLQAPKMLEDRSTRPTYAELAKRCADGGLPIGPKQPYAGDVGPMLAKFGVSREAFDALPDLPKDHELKRSVRK